MENFTEQDDISFAEFQQKFKNQKPSKDMETRTINALSARNLLNAKGNKKITWSISVAALLIFFTFGMMAGKLSLFKTANLKNQYLMLLYEPRNFDASASHVQEYSKWYHMLEKKKNISAGEELADKGWLLSQKGDKVLKNLDYISGQSGKISGFFIINASSENEAMAIATTCPHIKYNGIVEVRPVQYH